MREASFGGRRDSVAHRLEGAVFLARAHSPTPFRPARASAYLDSLSSVFRGICVVMRRAGRPPAWNEEQRLQVLELADGGASQREIAVEVFGDARYRGRVERILGSRHEPRRSSRLPRISAAVDEDGVVRPSGGLALVTDLVLATSGRYSRATTCRRSARLSGCCGSSVS